MPTERIDIIVTERGSRVVRRNFQDIGRSAASTARGLDFLRGTLIALGTSIVIRGLQEQADAYTLISNRIRLATAGSIELAAANTNISSSYRELYELSLRTRTGFEDTARTFSRVAIAGRDAGISLEEATEITETLNKSLIVSGATVREQRSALLQFSQAFAAGVLQGEELRAIREAAPLVAEAFAQELGGSIEDLKRFAEQGLLTRDVMRGALNNMRDDIEGAFAGINITIGQALTNLGTQFIDFLGDAEDATSITRRLVDAIGILGDSLPQVATALTAAVAALATTKVVALVAALSNPVTAASLGALLAIAGISGAYVGAIGRREQSLEAGRALGGLNAQADSILGSQGERLDAGVRLATAQELRDTIIDQIGRFDRDQILRQGSREGHREAFLNFRAAEEIVGRLDSFLAESDERRVRDEAFRERAQEASAQIPNQSSAALALAERSSRPLPEGISEVLDPIADYTRPIQQRIKLFDLSEREVEIQRRLNQITNQALEDERPLRGDQISDIRALLELEQDRIELANRNEFLDTHQAEIEARQELLGLTGRQAEIEQEVIRFKQRAAAAGVSLTQQEIDNARAVAEAYQEQRDAFRLIEDIAESTADNISDAFADLVTTGKFQFRDLAQSIIADIARIHLQQTITRPIANFLTSALGSAVGGSFFGSLTNPSTGFLGTGLAAPGTFSTSSFAGSFNTGGGFTVGGGGGVDSQLVAFRATPGERVNVSRPGDEPNTGSGVTQNFTFNISGVSDMESFRRSESQLAASVSRAADMGRRNQ